MIVVVTKSYFRDAFLERRPENFSRKALDCLFEYLTEIEDDSGEQVEVDVISICCAFCEYESLEEFHGDYSKEDYPDLDAISERTVCLDTGDGGFVIESF
tara:strand:- start:141 stop:440 length:300 start_codon:yes stop_codon:yes gene_type:complete